MTAAKRRINSTGRRRISRENVEVRILDSLPDQYLRATVSLHLKPGEFPESARIVVEAYQRSSLMRFDSGTVGSPSVPPVLNLEQLDPASQVLFRVKVIDVEVLPGRLLGAAERIQPRDENETEQRQSIFPIRTTDLGSELWRVDVGDEVPPVLLLNNRVPGILQKLLSDPFARGILLPAAFRVVLTELMKNTAADEEDDSDWQPAWIDYCRALLGPDGDPDSLKSDEERDSWVDAVVQKFCDNFNVVENVIRDKAEEHAQ